MVESLTMRWEPFMGDSVRVKVVEDGFPTTKTISRGDFISVVSSTDDVFSQVKRIGQLPVGFVDGGYDASGKSMDCIIRLPAETRPFSWAVGGETELFNVPFPDLVFYFQVHNSRLVKSHCYFAKAGSDELFQYQFANVYNGGNICWGNTTVPHIESMKDCEKLVRLFLSAPSNDDLFGGHHISIVVTKKGKETKKTPTQREYLNYVIKNKGIKDFGDAIGNIKDLV